MDLWASISSSPWLRSDKAAIVTSDRSISYRHLFESSERLSGGLRDLEPANGCLVVLCVGEGVTFAAAWLGLVRRGFGVALLSPLSGRSEWTSIEDALGPLPLVATAGTAERLGAGGRERKDLDSPAPGPRLFLYSPPGDRRSVPPDVAVVKFTSGSTGRPKAIRLSAENVLVEAGNVRDALGIEAGDRILAPVPLHHSYGFDLGFLQMLLHGARLAVDRGFIPRRVLRRLGNGEADLFLGVPAMYRFLLDGAPPDDARSLFCRHLLSCTAPLAPDLVVDFHDRFDALICQHYGSSETGAVTNHRAAEVLRRPRSVGRAIPGVTVSIVDEQGNSLPPGCPGEIEVTSRAVSGGYLMGGPEASPFRAGSFRMGDRGVMDEDGFLEVLGRLDDIINVGGYKVSPEEITRVLQMHPGVREACAFGIDDRFGGQVVEALVVPVGLPSESELLRHCRERLAEFKVPRRLVFCREIPRLPSGKVNRAEIRGRG